MYIIIGQGAAGAAAANELRHLNPAVPITVVTEEEDYFYSRIDLPDIIAGKYDESDSVLQSAEQFNTARITCKMGQRVVSIDPKHKDIELASGERIAYNKLLLATGSTPVILPVEGANATGIHAVWTLQQARNIIAAANSAKSAVVVGAGLIGMKTALALAVRGLSVTVVEKLPRILPRQLDELASGLIATQVQEKGVKLALGTSVERIEQTPDGKVCGIRVDGQNLACDLVIMAVGVRANVELARTAGLNVERGIVVNEFMQTSEESIFAAGDVAEVVDTLSGLPVVPAIWPEAVEQGLIAARNMAGVKAIRIDGAALNSVEIAGMPIVSIGDIEGNANDDVITFHKGSCYRKVVMRDRVLRGVLCVGDIRHAGVLGNLVLRQTEVEYSERIAQPTFSFADFMAM
ncbi:MAG: nasB [Anaerosporomusa subterranea]|jgi:NAD(P)H-nitrite reductase large subunit|nr:nasB [Anaerosporomusa subterranea]